MSAVVCGSKRSHFEEHPSTASPIPITKKLRRCSPPPGSAAPGVFPAPSLLDSLSALFPHMDAQVSPPTSLYRCQFFHLLYGPIDRSIDRDAMFPLLLGFELQEWNLLFWPRVKIFSWMLVERMQLLALFLFLFFTPPIGLLGRTKRYKWGTVNGVKACEGSYRLKPESAAHLVWYGWSIFNSSEFFFSLGTFESVR